MKQDTSPRVSQRDKLKGVLQFKPFIWTDKQKEFINLVLDKKTNIVICKGPSGTSKTMLSVYCGLKLLDEKRVSEIVYIRSPCESSSFGLGYLKGDLSEKFSPYTWPLEDKLIELLSKPDIDKLKNDNRIITKPIGFIRGSSMCVSYIICEESQNFRVSDFLLLMTRLGRFSKMIFIGDESQSDIRNGALDKIYYNFDDDESKIRGIHTFSFHKEDIMRNEILGYIIGKFEKLNVN